MAKQSLLNKHKRMPNIELLRFICMALIVICHLWRHQIADYPVHGILNNGLRAFMIATSFHVDVFVLITGYFGVRNYKKSLVNALTTMLWYATIIGAIEFIVTGNMNWQTIAFPISHSPWWFMRLYIYMVLLAPLFEIVIATFEDGKEWKYMICIMLTFNLWFGWLMHDKSIYSDFSLVNFLTLYVIGRYIRNLTDNGKLKVLVKRMGGGKNIILYFIRSYYCKARCLHVWKSLRLQFSYGRL